MGLAFRPSPERLRLGDPFSLGTVLSPLHSLGVWSSPVILLGLLVSENVPLRPRGVRPFLRAFSSVPLTWHPAWLQLVMGLILPHVFPCWILVSCDFWPAARSSSPWGSPPSYYHASLSSRGPFSSSASHTSPYGFPGTPPSSALTGRWGLVLRPRSRLRTFSPCREGDWLSCTSSCLPFHLRDCPPFHCWSFLS